MCTGMNLLSPYLVNRIIDYIENKESGDNPPTFKSALIYVGLLVATQALFYLISEHLEYYQKMIGVKSSNALVAMIYRKQLKISSATNKRFSQGEVVNFVQVDAQKMQRNSDNLVYMTRYPLVIIVCFTFLFNYIGFSFLAGVAIFAIAFGINIILTRISARLQKRYMECQDDRLNTTTESLNNIKMLKLYSWTDKFEATIEKKRNLELSVFWKRLNVGMLSVSSLYFFPQVLSAVVFSVYIGTGSHLELGMAYTVMTCFNLLKVCIFRSVLIACRSP